MDCQELLPHIPEGSFVQWSTDNVDHNSRTLYGKDTFHGMGIIASITPSIKKTSTLLGKGDFSKSLKDSSSEKNIPILEYIGEATFPQSLTLKPYSLLKESVLSENKEGRSLDMVWLTNWISKPLLPKRANWSGFMQKMHSTKRNQNTSSVIMMPLIDLQSSNPTCIYSTLLFIEDQAH